MSNIWKKFQSLIPKQKEIIGEIISTNSSSKTSIIEMASGSTVIVRGIGNVGSFYLVRDGVLSNEMPNLTIYNETI